MNNLRTTTAFALLVFLGACGGSSGDSDTETIENTVVGAEQVTRGNVPDAVVVSYDAMTDTISITDDDITDTLEANTLLDTQGFTGYSCLLYTSPSPRDKRQSRMPSSA